MWSAEHKFAMLRTCKTDETAGAADDSGAEDLKN